MIIRLDSQPAGRSAQSSARLSPREMEVVNLAELQRRDIAMVLDISEHTAKAHLASIYKKLGVETRGQIVAWRERKAA